MLCKLTRELDGAKKAQPDWAFGVDRDVANRWSTPDSDMSRCRKTQDSGHQTGSSCISRSILDSNEIPKPTISFRGRSSRCSPTPYIQLLTPETQDGGPDRK
jgi:hypothetical protein